MNKTNRLKVILSRLFKNRSNWKDIQEISEYDFVNNQMKKQWSQTQSVEDSIIKERIWSKINARKEASKTFTIPKRMAYIVAATITIAIVIASKALLVNHTTPAVAQSTTYIEVYADGYLKYQLPDSSTIWMHPNSSIRFNKDFKKQRDIWLKGESIFEVKNQGNELFIVHANQTKTAVLGTVFRVKSTANKSSSEVTLYEGSVRFEAESNHRQIIMTPGQTIKYDSENNTTTLTDNQLLSWDNGKLLFTEMSLKDLVQIINLQYSINIKFNEAIDENSKLTGTINHNDNLEDILYKMCYALNANVKKETNNILIYK